MLVIKIDEKIKKAHITVISVLLVTLLLLPLFIRQQYYLHVVIMLFWATSCTLAWNIIGGFAGQISLGHAVFMGFGAYATALVQTKFELPPVVGLVLGIIFVVIFTTIFFYPCFCLRGPYFIMATLGLTIATRNAFFTWELIGKGEGLILPFRSAHSWYWFQFTDKKPYYYAALVLAVSFILVSIFISKSRFGYALKAIKENENTASAVGINKTKYKLYAMLLSTVMISICGSFYVNYLRFVDPDVMVLQSSIEMVLPAVMGGIGTVVGPIIGAIVFVPMAEILRVLLGGVIAGAHYVLIAVIMIIIIQFKPEGLHDLFMRHYIKMLKKIMKVD